MAEKIFSANVKHNFYLSKKLQKKKIPNRDGAMSRFGIFMILQNRIYFL